MPCRELRFVLSVVFYVVNENPQNRIRLKSCKKKETTPEILRFQVLFWSCWADSNRRPHPYQWDGDFIEVYYCTPKPAFGGRFLLLFVPFRSLSVRPVLQRQ